MNIVDLRDDRLNIGEAIFRTKYHAKKMKRPHWKGYWFFDRPYLVATGTTEEGALGKMITTSVDTQKMEPMLIAKLENGNLVPAQAYQDDLLAEDWIVFN